MNQYRSAICSLSWGSRKPLPSIIDTISRLGIQGIEIWLPQLATLALTPLTATLKEKNISVVCISAPWGSCFWEHSPVLLHYAKTLGAQGIKVFGDTFNPTDNLPARLREFCSQAKEADLEVYLETHGGQPRHNTADNTLALLHATNAPNLKVILDLYNTHETGETMESAAEKLAPFLCHFHIKWGYRNERNDYIPLPVSQAPTAFRNVLSRFAEKPFWYSIEHYESDEDILDALAVMKSILPITSAVI
ncbi:MAG: hypothetical protein A2293_14855 [Elusimicrobia bacterium RIFOXYB2_FULL_49_7]|nr:MAG: hypothetical protein A2293_14855 [Elusimicrobia bacterium RIFOXYB2_FULL_49_7]